MKYLFSNIINNFVLDDNLKIVDQGPLIQLKKKHLDLKELPQDKNSLILCLFRDKKYHRQFYENNIILTKKSIKESVSEDWLIIQAIANVNELDKIINVLTKRLREWYGLYFPELEYKIHNNELFVKLILEKEKEELLKEFKIKETMGAELDQFNLQEIKFLAEEINKLSQLRHKHEKYLQDIMRDYCPNLLELAGVTIGAKLIELGRSLKHLAMLPASTIQLLGAEKALFRHIKTGSKSPKYGVIINHPIIQKAQRNKKGKASRSLADKLSLCVRLDYFKGELKAKQYLKELEEKFI